MPDCRHCLRPCGAHARGLCRSCYAKPGVRGLYPPLRGNGPRVPDRPRRVDWPAPTAALPGTEAKLAVLAARAAAGQWLFHPRDARPEVA